ncbi:hypothetical protein F2Q69_00053980 [Brassica cretica]|uniref:Uncharacterized protein n=1 Tax=Brassica cretica TaxID=69181 RepID=A0A8S9N6K6_BRACR|nr:hypothetical protein F2Q69_00053980 [Brassica cretica]
MKVDLAQQKEIEDEENAEMNSITSVFSAASALTSEEEKRLIEEEDDVDDFDDISIMIVIKSAPLLLDIIFKKFKDNESRLAEERSDPQMDPMIAKLYKGKTKRLHFALFQALKMSLYKPIAFNKGILFSLCKVTPEILRELQISRNHGERDDPMLTNFYLLNNRIKEDRLDMSEVPMEKD